MDDMLSPYTHKQSDLIFFCFRIFFEKKNKIKIEKKMPTTLSEITVKKK